MGWNTANDIFNIVAEKLIECDVPQVSQTQILVPLLTYLQGEDWDTEDESLELFVNYPGVVNAFSVAEHLRSL